MFDNFSFEVLALAYQQVGCKRVALKRGFFAFKLGDKSTILQPAPTGFINLEFAIRDAHAKFGPEIASRLEQAIHDILDGRGWSLTT